MNGQTQHRSEPSWFKAYRTEDAFELLLLNKNAFILLWVIHHRARWTDGFNRHGLKRGEAMLGDYEHYDMSEQEYRTAKKHLLKHGFATFRRTNKGTIATPLKAGVFGLGEATSNAPSNGRSTNGKRTDPDPGTTNLEGIQGVEGVERVDIKEAEAVYSLYPRKVRMPKAIEAIVRAIKRHGYSVVHERTELFAKTCNRELRYIPHPTTFFNGEQYNDDPSTWVSNPSPKNTQVEHPKSKYRDSF
jgi:hypothetical protein